MRKQLQHHVNSRDEEAIIDADIAEKHQGEEAMNDAETDAGTEDMHKQDLEAFDAKNTDFVQIKIRYEEKQLTRHVEETAAS